MGRAEAPPFVIVPANLRKQWSVELADKFHLPSTILETKSFNAAVKAGNLNPFDQAAILLCSYQFARSKEAYVSRTEWDLVVIDEAHRLRNVYKNSNKIAQAIRSAVADRPKVLLTATPLQNSLVELYGLVSIVDPYAFGDAKSFSSRFVRPRNNGEAFAELKSRLAPILKRTHGYTHGSRAILRRILPVLGQRIMSSPIAARSGMSMMKITYRAEMKRM